MKFDPEKIRNYDPIDFIEIVDYKHLIWASFIWLVPAICHFIFGDPGLGLFFTCCFFGNLAMWYNYYTSGLCDQLKSTFYRNLYFKRFGSYPEL